MRYHIEMPRTVMIVGRLVGRRGALPAASRRRMVLRRQVLLVPSFDCGKRRRAVARPHPIASASLAAKGRY